MPFTAREIYIPEFLLEVSRCTWIELVYGTRFSELITEENNQFGTGYVQLNAFPINCSGIPSGIRRTIGKKEHCQQECTTGALMGKRFHREGTQRRLGLDNILKGTREGQSLSFIDFSVLRAGREVE